MVVVVAQYHRIMVAMIGAALNWLQARPWRPGWLLVATVGSSFIAPVAGAVASVLVAPVAMFVTAYNLWWMLRGWVRAAVVVIGVAWPIAVSAVFGLGFSSFTTAAYTLGTLTTTVAFLGGYLWGRHREGQEESRGPQPVE